MRGFSAGKTQAHLIVKKPILGVSIQTVRFYIASCIRPVFLTRETRLYRSESQRNDIEADLTAPSGPCGCNRGRCLYRRRGTCLHLAHVRNGVSRQGLRWHLGVRQSVHRPEGTLRVRNGELFETRSHPSSSSHFRAGVRRPARQACSTRGA